MNSKTVWTLLLAALLVLGLSGCGDSTDQPTEPGGIGDEADPGDDGPNLVDPGPTGNEDVLITSAGVPAPSVSGRIVDMEGTPVAGAKILCCTLAICYSGETSEEGTYAVGGLSSGGWKLQLLGGGIGSPTFVWYQKVTDMMLDHPLDVDVVAVAQTSEPVFWSEAEGGTVVSADGELELTANPPLDESGDRLLEDDGDPVMPLDGPIGWDDTIQAVKVAQGDLPPYDEQPWDAQAGEVHAFHIDPFKIHGNVPVQLRLLNGPYGAAGDVYTLYEINTDYGTVSVAGTAVVAEDGTLVSADDANLTHLSTVVIVGDGGAGAEEFAAAEGRDPGASVDDRDGFGMDTE